MNRALWWEQKRSPVSCCFLPNVTPWPMSLFLYRFASWKQLKNSQEGEMNCRWVWAHLPYTCRRNRFWDGRGARFVQSAVSWSYPSPPAPLSAPCHVSQSLQEPFAPPISLLPNRALIIRRVLQQFLKKSTPDICCMFTSTTKTGLGGWFRVLWAVQKLQSALILFLLRCLFF